MSTECLTIDTIGEKLRKPLAHDYVQWRIGMCGKSGEKIWARLLAYMDNRAVMDRLDEVVGPMNWSSEFKPGPSGGNLCCISIRIGSEWVTKCDGAENTDFEPIKGGLSDAMKRAGVQWGIGRYLYDVGESWAECQVEAPSNREGWHHHSEKKSDLKFWWRPGDKAIEALRRATVGDTPPAPPANGNAPKNGTAPQRPAQQPKPTWLSGSIAKIHGFTKLAEVDAAQDKLDGMTDIAAEHRTELQATINRQRNKIEDRAVEQDRMPAVA